MHIIAFSGIGNTGKSTIINKTKERLEKKGMKVTVKGEIAREVLQKIGHQENMSLFQEEISKEEYIRAKTLHQENADVVLVDRTYMDNLAYFVYNSITQKIQGETKISMPDTLPYDKVIYFDTPIKLSSTTAFQHYDNKNFHQLMSTIVKGRFGEKVQQFRNGKKDEKEIIKFVEEVIAQDTSE